MTRSAATFAASLALVLSPAAVAQTSGFELVDQTVEDVSPLSSSLQELQPDAGPPQDFGRVNQLEAKLDTVLARQEEEGTVPKRSWSSRRPSSLRPRRATI